MDRLGRAISAIGRAEFLFVWYGLTITVLLVLHGQTVEGRWLWVLFHLAYVPAAWVVTGLRPTWLWCLLIMVWVVTCFSTMGMYIGDLVPEPMQWQVHVLNEAIGGGAVQAALARPPAWLVEACVISYSTFYFLPLALTIALAREKKWLAIRHVIVLMCGGFLLSYLGYLCWPTLPPYRYLVFDDALVGGPLFPTLHRWLYEGEALRQDCMPSGHTMMTVLTLWLGWTYCRRQLTWLVPLAFFLILGTLVLRYHWFVDLVAAIPFVWLALVLFDDPEARRLEGQRGVS